MALSYLLIKSALTGVQIDLKRASVPNDRRFSAMCRARQRELHQITDKLIAGEVDPFQWADQFSAVLLEGHTAAWHMGRNRAGDLSSADIDDLLRGIAKTDAEKEYLTGFLHDLLAKDPRYWDEAAQAYRETIKSRQDAYLGKLRGTANEAFTKHTPEELDSFLWRLGGTELHCIDCPILAEMSEETPFTKSTIFQNPGDGRTPCKTNCLCHWERVDGRTGFKRVEF